MCADLTTVSSEVWSPPCRMCGQLLLVLPDRASPTVRSEIGTLCYQCWPEFVEEKMRTNRRWDAQYTVLMTAKLAGLPASTRARIADILSEPENSDPGRAGREGPG